MFHIRQKHYVQWVLITEDNHGMFLYFPVISEEEKSIFSVNGG